MRFATVDGCDLHQLIGGKHPMLLCWVSTCFNHPPGDSGFRNPPQYEPNVFLVFKCLVALLPGALYGPFLKALRVHMDRWNSYERLQQKPSGGTNFQQIRRNNLLIRNSTKSCHRFCHQNPASPGVKWGLPVYPSLLMASHVQSANCSGTILRTVDAYTHILSPCITGQSQHFDFR